MKVLELEDMLEKERTKLGKLRKAHYQLAVELYGEEEVSNFIKKLLTIVAKLSILDVWRALATPLKRMQSLEHI